MPSTNSLRRLRLCWDNIEQKFYFWDLSLVHNIKCSQSLNILSQSLFSLSQLYLDGVWIMVWSQPERWFVPGPIWRVWAWTLWTGTEEVVTSLPSSHLSHATQSPNPYLRAQIKTCRPHIYLPKVSNGRWPPSFSEKSILQILGDTSTFMRLIYPQYKGKFAI